MSVTRGRVVHAASTDPLAVSALRHIGPGAKGAIPSDQFPFRSDEIVGKPLPDSPRSGYPTLKTIPAAFALERSQVARQRLSSESSRAAKAALSRLPTH